MKSSSELQLMRVSAPTTFRVDGDLKESERYAEYERRIAEKREAEFDERLLRSGIPKRLIRATFDSFDAPTPDHRVALLKGSELVAGFVHGRPAPARCALLYGPPGTGKTHFACAFMRVVAPYFGVRYTTVSSLARAVRSTYHRNATETEQDVLDAHIKPSLLTIDEVGVGLGTDHERAMLHDVVAGRYDAQKPTILISNLDLEAVKAAIGERLVDRLREDNGMIVPFLWDSYRGAQK